MLAFQEGIEIRFQMKNHLTPLKYVGQMKQMILVHNQMDFLRGRIFSHCGVSTEPLTCFC